MNKNKKDYLIFTLSFQFLFCCLLFAFLFSIKDTSNWFINTIENDFFNNIDKNKPIIEEYKPSDEVGVSADAQVTEKTPVISDNMTITESKEQTTNILSASVQAWGGADYGVGDESDIPENVSINDYTLTKEMIIPVSGEITSEFGLRIHPISGEKRFHAGIDIAADTGTDIYASFDGEVIVADYDQWNGYYIKIIHDADIMTVYCHCNELFVKKGDVVKAGDKIAEIGSTGSSTGPHLHFELRINNISYDPQIAMNGALNAD